MFQNIKNILSIVIAAVFVLTSIEIPQVHAGQVTVLLMPHPGDRVELSSAYIPAHLTGLIIHPDNPLKFDFLVHKGEGRLDEDQKKLEYKKLVKYFLASLTIPDIDQWVNLSPYEHNRIIKDNFGTTEMGRDLLAQDYLLKQITSSLMYPESSLGRSFWNRIYERAWKEYKTTQVPVNTFNKVWIVPDEAAVYESGNTVYILKSHLKVMLEEDYLSLSKHQLPTRGHVPREALSPSTLPSDKGLNAKAPQGNPPNALASQIIREIILPELEKEVNTGKNFAVLRQVLSGMILATWYKKALKESILARVYADKSKVKGVNIKASPVTIDNIYQNYLKAFKKGVFNYIKEDVDTYSQQSVPRKYFAGGIFNPGNVDIFNLEHKPSAAMAAGLEGDFAQKAVDETEVDLISQQVGVRINRRKVLLGALSAGAYVGLDSMFPDVLQGQKGPVWDDFTVGIRTKVKYSGKTDSKIYLDGSSLQIRKILEHLQAYQYAFYNELIKDAPDNQEIIKLQEALRIILLESINEQELSKVSDKSRQDLMKMSFSSFMFEFTVKYLARFNIVMLASFLPFKDKLQVEHQLLSWEFYEISDVKERILKPEDLWGVSLKVDQVILGKEILISGRRMDPGKYIPLNRGRSSYGNIFLFYDVILKSLEEDINFAKQENVRKVLLMPEKGTLSAIRKLQKESQALAFSYTHMAALLSQIPRDQLLQDFIDEIVYHEAKHVLDYEQTDNIAMEVDGHLTAMRKNNVGWVHGWADAEEATATSSMNYQKDTYVAMKYITHKTVEYIQSQVHLDEFKFIDGQDVYAIKGQLHKITDVKLRRRIIDYVYKEHQKEYGHEKEIISGNFNQQGAHGPVTASPAGEKTLNSWSVAVPAAVLVGGGGGLALWRYNRVRAVRAEKMAEVQQAAAEISRIAEARRLKQEAKAEKKGKKEKGNPSKAQIAVQGNKNDAAMTRRGLGRTAITAIAGWTLFGNLQGQNPATGVINPVIRAIFVAQGEKVKYSDRKTDSQIYAPSSNHRARKVLETIQRYQNDVFGMIYDPLALKDGKLLPRKAVFLEQIVALRNKVQDQLIEDMGETWRPSSPMDFEVFMLRVVANFLAQESNIILLPQKINILNFRQGEVLPVIPYQCFEVEQVKAVEKRRPRSWGGQVLRTDRVIAGKEIMLNENSLTPIRSKTPNSQSLYANIVHFSNVIQKTIKDLRTLQQGDLAAEAMPLNNFLRAIQGEKRVDLPLIYSGVKSKKYLSSRTPQEVDSGVKEAALDHETQHGLDSLTDVSFYPVDKEIRGYLAQIRSSYIGWLSILAYAYSSKLPSSTDDDQAVKYIMQRIMEYIRSNSTLFPFIIGRQTDEIEAQLYKIGEPKETKEATAQSLAVLQNMVDHIFLQHEKELQLKINSNKAQIAVQIKPSETDGGIDMNSANMAMAIKRDGRGVVLPLDQQDLAQLSLAQGFDPDIIAIKPYQPTVFVETIAQD